jgi:hypothetical protein
LDLFEEFQSLVKALNDRGIDYAVVGALALAIHGVPRATTDIDLLVQREDVERILEVVAEFGFTFPAAPMTFSSGLSVQRVTKVQDEDTLMLDLVLVNPHLEEIWESRTKIGTTHGSVWALSREGLIKMKSMSGRLTDLADVERLEGENNG